LEVILFINVYAKLKVMNKNRGFTIVELLVVIVVIGVLAAITIVSFTGISNRAIVSSLQSDLSSNSNILKMYYTEYGSYPTNDLSTGSHCPTSPTYDSKYCLKPSLGNSLSYCSLSPYSTFQLKSTATNGTTYRITENTTPQLSSGGGSIIFGNGIGQLGSGSCDTRIHTFAPGTYNNIPVLASGTLTITIKGAGGGGGAGSDTSGSGGGGGGGFSSLTYNSTTYIAAGGGGGGGAGGESESGGSGTNGIGTGGGAGGNGGNASLYSCYSGGAGAPGSGSASGSMTLGGVGSGGGGSNGSCPGSSGGAGGKVTGTINVSVGQTISIVVGSGGAGGSGEYDGYAGDDGSVVISYSI
jgi:prepilin-type N-terminal cleavage/methylation domain-containing protein